MNNISKLPSDHTSWRTLVDLDHLTPDQVTSAMDCAKEIKRGTRDVSDALEGKLLVPLFMQDSSRTYMNSVSSFIRMGGQLLPLNVQNTRFGSHWKEPIQDFACLLNSCANQIICRSGDKSEVLELAGHLTVPFINAGNGEGTGSEHPMQALIDLHTLQETFGHRHLNILMIGGTHIRTSRTQIKLFLKVGHHLTILSHPPCVENSDVEELIDSQCERWSASSNTDWSAFDVIYHNGADENADVSSPEDYLLTSEKILDRKFNGKIMHSLPRKNELPNCFDDTPFNLYFTQMRNSKWVFQSVFLHQHGLN